ncbi:hypothetical protein Q3G72_028906 [Acer saccharum]|nr:hypothetical protein Q3G72_028906 [Acer saccharum]
MQQNFNAGQTKAMPRPRQKSGLSQHRTQQTQQETRHQMQLNQPTTLPNKARTRAPVSSSRRVRKWQTWHRALLMVSRIHLEWVIRPATSNQHNNSQHLARHAINLILNHF